MRLLVLLAFLLGGCASINQMMGIPTNIGNGYKIEQDREIYGGGVKIEYRDNALLKQKVALSQETRMAPAAETDEKLESLPKGMIILTYEALTIDAANTKWLEYVVLKDGKEIARRKGLNQVPEVPNRGSSGVGYWWSTDAVSITVDPPFQLLVIDTLDGKRDTFTISPRA